MAVPMMELCHNLPGNLERREQVDCSVALRTRCDLPSGNPRQRPGWSVAFARGLGPAASHRQNCTSESPSREGLRRRYLTIWATTESASFYSSTQLGPWVVTTDLTLFAGLTAGGDVSPGRLPDPGARHDLLMSTRPSPRSSTTSESSTRLAPPLWELPRYRRGRSVVWCPTTFLTSDDQIVGVTCPGRAPSGSTRMPSDPTAGERGRVVSRHDRAPIFRFVSRAIGASRASVRNLLVELSCPRFRLAADRDRGIAGSHDGRGDPRDGWHRPRSPSKSSKEVRCASSRGPDKGKGDSHDTRYTRGSIYYRLQVLQATSYGHGPKVREDVDRENPVGLLVARVGVETYQREQDNSNCSSRLAQCKKP